MLEFEFSLAGVFALIFLKALSFPCDFHISAQVSFLQKIFHWVLIIFQEVLLPSPIFQNLDPCFLTSQWLHLVCLFIYWKSLFFPLQILRKQNHVTSSSELYLQPVLFFSLAFSVYFAVLVYKTVSWVCSSYIWFTAFKCDLYIFTKQ